MRATSYFLQGSVIISGELDKNGFKKLLFHAGEMSGSYEGKISKDGNMIEFDPNKEFYFELSRK